MLVPSMIVRFVILFFSSLGFISLLPIMIEFQDKIDDLKLYLLMVFLIISVITTLDIIEQVKYIQKEKINKFLFLPILISICFSIYAVYDESNARSVWLDEASQFSSSTKIEQKNEGIDILQRAAREQQPPFGYILSNFSKRIAGNSVLAVRFFSVFSFFLLATLFPVMLYAQSKSILVSLMGSIMFVSNAQLITYSIEGRPFMLVALFCFMYLILIIESIREQKTFDGLLVAICLFFMAITLSLLPQIIALGVFLALAVIFINNKYKLKKLLSSHVLGGLLSLPVLIYLYQYNTEINHLKPLDGTSIDWHNVFINFRNQYQIFMRINKLMFVGLGLSVLYIIISKFTKAKLLKLGSFYIVSILVFISGTIIFMTTMVNWVIYPRYFILMNLIPIVTLPFFIEEIKKSKKIVFIVILGLFAYISGNDYHSYQRDKRNEFRRSLNTNKLYHFLKEETNTDDIATLMNFTYLGEWRANSWIATDIYYDKNHAQLIDRSVMGELIPFIPHSYFENKENRNVYILSRKNWTKFEIADVIKERLIFKKNFGSDYRLVKVNIKNIEDWKNFIENLIEKTPKELRFILYEVLIAYYIVEQNRSKFEQYVNLYKNNPIFPENTYEAQFKNGFQVDRIRMRDQRVLDFYEMYKRPKDIPDKPI